MRGADNCADGGEAALADEVGAPFRHELGHLMPDMAAVGEDEILHLAAAGVRRLDDAEETGAAPAARREERVERVAPEIGVHGHGVGERLTAVGPLEIRGRVRPRGRADVTALRVGDHLEARRARIRAHVLEPTDAVGAEGLEKRDLGLDRHDVRRDRVDDAAAEAGARVGGVRPSEVRISAQLHREQVRAGIEPDDELRALVLDGLREAVGEVRRRDGRHVKQRTDLRRRRPSKCRETAKAAQRTAFAPRRRECA